MSRSVPHKAAIIRANGSKTIGMGHLSRTSLLAQAFRSAGISTKFVLKEDSDGERFLSQRNISFSTLPKEITFEDELAELRNQVAASSASIFVIDVLNFPDYFRFLKSLKELDCLTVLIFDEIEKKKIDADIVLNGNPCQLGHNYSDFSGRYLMGPRYFIVDPRYKEVSINPPKKEVKNILLTVGGADHNDLLFKVINALEALDEKYHVKIFSTTSTGYVDRLKKRLAGADLSHELFLDEKTLVPFWSGCDVAITAGGNTLFERIVTRLPGATLCQIDLQMKIADAFEKMGVNINLGHGVDVTENELTGKLKTFLNDFETHERQYAKAAGIVDGRGLEYLMEAINEL